MSNFASGIRCKVVPGIRANDHDGVLTTVNVGIPASTPVGRLVYDYKQVDWNKLKTELAAAQWGEHLEEASSDEAATLLTNTILLIVNKSIPSKWIIDKSCSHPWINDACHEALRIKCGARGTNAYIAVRDACSATSFELFRNTLARPERH